ncbi:MAG TPA: translocation/assembly module TamB domain-containing protein, partial [Polyangiaceae bacterium]
VRVNDPPRVSQVASARGVIRLQARFRPARSSLEASATADLTNLRAPSVEARRVELRAAASGPVENPRLEAHVLAEDVTAADRRITRVQATARGTKQELQLAVEATGRKPDRLRARTRLGLAPELSLRETEIRIEDGKDLAITVTAAAIELSGGTIRVADLGLLGAGEARASLTWTGRLSRMELVTRELQPVRILKALGVDAPIEAASLTMTAHYAEREAGPMGSISGNADEIRADKLSNGAVRFDLALANRTLSGSLDASAQGAKIRIDADEIRIPNPPYDAGALERMDGALTASGQIDLTQMESLLTQLLPIASSAGKITFGLQASRPRGGNEGPRIQASIDTVNLRITGQRQTEHQPGSAQVARATKPWSIERIDLSADAEVDAGAGVARLEATLKDKAGELFTLRAGATPEPTRSLRTLLDRDYTRVPLRVRLTMPPRALEKLPEIAQTQGLRGVASLDAALEGTLREPRLLADADVTCLATEEMKQMVDLSLSAEYEPGRGRLALDAASEGSSIGELRAKWEGDPARLTEAPLESRQSPVQGELALRLTRFPLELIPPLSDQQIRGPMSGNVEVKGFGKDARMTAKFHTDRVLVGTVGVQKFELSVDTEKDHLVGKLQIGGNNGLASAEVRAPFQWGSRVVPVVEERLEARLNAKNFRLETLAPLVAAQLSELEGRLDAAVEARLAGGQKPEVAGWAVVRRGVVHVPALGQRFRSIESRVSIDKGNVKLERLTARGVTGKLSVVGGAKLDGLSLRTAEAHVRIPRGDRIPVTIEGSAIGDAWGKIDVGVKVSERDRTTRIDVDVPEFTLEMPESNPAALQDLALPQDVRLGTRLAGGDFVTMPIQPLEGEKSGTSAAPSLTLVEVSLGRDVWLRKGQQVEVQVGGRILVRQKEQARISGKIELVGGTLDVQGKRFDIERGVVTFVGPDPANPTISAVARWDSPEGYTVYAEYTGTAQEGKLTLRSEPALTDNEILSLLMFGTPDGSFGSGEGGGTAETAIGLAGGTAAQGLNRALSSITDLDVSARIDTSTGTARPELVVQLTPRVTARVTRAVGDPPTGQSPDRTFLTLDFRIQRAWSLSAMIGDRGASALDLIWRKRY